MVTALSVWDVQSFLTSGSRCLEANCGDLSEKAEVAQHTCERGGVWVLSRKAAAIYFITPESYCSWLDKNKNSWCN